MVNEPPGFGDLSRIDAVPVILDVICRTTGLGFAAIARVTSEQWIAQAVRDEAGFGFGPGSVLPVDATLCKDLHDPGEIIVIDHVARDERYSDHAVPQRFGFQSYIAVPIVLRDGRFGTLCALDRSPARIDTPETRAMFGLFARLIAFYLEQNVHVADLEQQVAVRTAALRAERHSLRELAGELQRAREDERESLAREVHDEIGQSLAVMRIEMTSVRSALQSGDPGKIARALETLDHIDAGLNGAIQDVQRIGSQLRPIVLDLLGFSTAATRLVGEFTQRTGIAASFADLTDRPLPDGLPIVFYRVLQESLTNISRHAGATSVAATLGVERDCFVLRIADDGRGVAGAASRASSGFGVRGMIERVRAAGGELRVASPERGTEVIASVPVGVPVTAAARTAAS